MLAHPLFPQIRKGLIPVVVEEGENLIQLLVFNRFNILSKLLQFHLRLGFTVVAAFQLLPEIPEPVFIDQVIAKVAALGRVNHAVSPV